MSDEREWDVVVVGAGGAGLAAAVTAAHRGLRVLVVEKGTQLGGATAWSGGNVWAPGHGLGSEPAASDREAARRYLLALTGELADVELIDTFLQSVPRMVAFFQRHTAVQFESQPRFGDYHADIPGASRSGRCITPLPFDGRLLGFELHALRQPLRQINAPFGMMIGFDDIDHLQRLTRSPRAMLHVAGMVTRLLVDRWRHGRGTRLTMGNALAARLLKSALDQGVSIWRSTPAANLDIRDGRICGLVVERGNQLLSISARRGVVLASGGFSASEALRRQFMPRPDHHVTLMPDTHTGDGLALGRQAGALLETRHHRNGDWVVVSAMRARDGSLTRCLHTVLDRPKPGCIAVNALGERFANEAASAMPDALCREPALPAWLICDDRCLRRYGLGLVPPGGLRLGRYQAAGYLQSAPDLATLAALIEVDAERLVASVARFNQFASEGVDRDFGRGSSEADRQLGEPGHLPNPSLGALRSAPFHAVQIVPGDASSYVGLRINRHAQVVGAGGVPIPGLYAAGLDAHSLWRGRPPSVGANNALSLTLGFLAAEHMAAGQRAGAADSVNQSETCQSAP